jgi:hypothetical protein
MTIIDMAIIDDDVAMQDSLRDRMEAAGPVAGCVGSAGSTRFRHYSSFVCALPHGPLEFGCGSWLTSRKNGRFLKPSY